MRLKDLLDVQERTEVRNHSDRVEMIQVVDLTLRKIDTEVCCSKRVQRFNRNTYLQLPPPRRLSGPYKLARYLHRQ